MQALQEQGQEEIQEQRTEEVYQSHSDSEIQIW